MRLTGARVRVGELGSCPPPIASQYQRRRLDGDVGERSQPAIRELSRVLARAHPTLALKHLHRFGASTRTVRRNVNRADRDGPSWARWLHGLR